MNSSSSAFASRENVTSEEIMEQRIPEAVDKVQHYLYMHRCLREYAIGGEYHGESAHLYPVVSYTDEDLEHMVRNNPAVLDSFSEKQHRLYVMSSEGSKDLKQRRFWVDACADQEAWDIQTNLYLIGLLKLEQAGALCETLTLYRRRGEMPWKYLEAIFLTEYELGDLSRSNPESVKPLFRIINRLTFTKEKGLAPGNELGLATPIVKHGEGYLICPDLLYDSLIYRATLVAYMVREVYGEESPNDAIN